MLFLGVDLAWGEVNETGVVALAESGRVIDADWTCGTTATALWIDERAEQDTLCFIDAPLVVENPARTMRECERQVGQCYGAWRVSANATNIESSRLGGVALRIALERQGWRYDDGFGGPPGSGLVVSECYPYTTIVGAAELGYEIERPAYKRRPKAIPTTAWRAQRATTCDELIARLAGLGHADPPLILGSHPNTATLVAESSPLSDPAYKHREDLLDAAVAAWTAALWVRHGLTRCQVLGNPAISQATASIIAPYRPRQLRE